MRKCTRLLFARQSHIEHYVAHHHMTSVKYYENFSHVRYDEKNAFEKNLKGIPSTRIAV